MRASSSVGIGESLRFQILCFKFQIAKGEAVESARKAVEARLSKYYAEKAEAEKRKN
jgi:hypothetical protein